MTDEIDTAQERDLLITSKAAEAATEKARAALANTGCRDCVGCGEEISAQRRAAYPAARHCVECQRRRERKVP